MPKFNNLRYATRGISSTLPLMLQIILWGLIDTMEVVEKDYLQIFTLTSENGKQKIVHEQEQPEYRKEYLFPARYHFLIMEGSGEVVSGLPSRMRTRLKNRLHRSVYLELEHYGDGRGVVRQCYYYDRAYLRQGIRVSPPMLVSCFLPYTREGILDLINHEICCNFTHIIFVSGADGIDLSSDDTPICGSI